MRYIDADLIRYDEDIPGVFIASKTRINNIPTADVRENIRGHWKLKTSDLYGLADKVTAWANYCSVCGYHYGTPYNFCPHCGSDMRGDNK